MPFAKGQSGNPGGRPKGSDYLSQLGDAIKRVEKRKSKKLLTHFVEQAYEDRGVLIALLKKFIADKKEQKIESDSGLVIKLVKYNDNDNNPP